MATVGLVAQPVPKAPGQVTRLRAMRSCHHAAAGALHHRGHRRGREMDEVAREVKPAPVPAEESTTGAAGIRNLHDEQPSGGEPADHASECGKRTGKMLDHVKRRDDVKAAVGERGIDRVADEDLRRDR